MRNVKLNKRGVMHLDKMGGYAVIVNRVLHDRGKARRFAVAHIAAAWVESGYVNRDQAVSRAQELHKQ